MSWDWQVLNVLGSKQTPFKFWVDFLGKEGVVAQLGDDSQLKVDFENSPVVFQETILPLSPQPIPFTEYQLQIESVLEEMRAGNTYLLNLTSQTAISLNLTLPQLYSAISAPYKALMENCICFSPESFVIMKDRTISTYPMKGTSSISSDSTGSKLLDNPKENEEHLMVVDLLRNDLSQIAENIRVNRFRYLEKIETSTGSLWQTSSEIMGDLEDNWPSRIGSILSRLIPAGSISGTPKASTLEIIKRVEKTSRGFYCGVFGVFDGYSLQSAVAIRYISVKDKSCYYHSGGGITAKSDAYAEYEEMLSKIYIPGVNNVD